MQRRYLTMMRCLPDAGPELIWGVLTTSAEVPIGQYNSDFKGVILVLVMRAEYVKLLYL